ncbi:hypothetical protein NTA38_33150, partial [Pseudomonas aeruginosa]|nr:hypothetical protein [Pseudomonas aeruginosa]
AIEQAGPYAAEDADVTLRLHQALWQKLEAIPSLARVLTDIEMPLVPVLARIERNGALVDANLLGIQSRELGEPRLNSCPARSYAWRSRATIFSP